MKHLLCTVKNWANCYLFASLSVQVWSNSFWQLLWKSVALCWPKNFVRIDPIDGLQLPNSSRFFATCERPLEKLNTLPVRDWNEFVNLTGRIWYIESPARWLTFLIPFFFVVIKSITNADINVITCSKYRWPFACDFKYHWPFWLHPIAASKNIYFRTLLVIDLYDFVVFKLLLINYIFFNFRIIGRWENKKFDLLCF